VQHACDTHAARRVPAQGANAIGTKSKARKYNLSTASILNLDPLKRTSMDDTLLLGVYNVNAAKTRGGICRMLAGTDSVTGQRFDEFSFAREINELTKGVEVEIPDDIRGGTMKIELEVHVLLFEADLLGAHGLSHLPESFKAQHPCQDCWWNQSKPRSGATCNHFGARTLEQHVANLKELRTTVFTSKKAKADAFRDKGVSKLYCVIEALLGGHPLEDIAPDIMHLFMCGITRHEGYWVLADLIGCGAFTWDQLNAQRKVVNSSLPKGHAVSHLEKPRTENKKKPAQTLLLNGAEVMHYAVNR
jgi:hypothetical protein